VVGLKTCLPCKRTFATWSRFGRHLVEVHHTNRAAFWRRANQVGDDPCVYVVSEAGDGFIMVQGSLRL
jgi:hypothetical protein